MVAIVSGILFVPVKTAIMPMTAKTPDKAARGLLAVDFSMHNGLHDSVKVFLVEETKFANQIDFFATNRLQIFTNLPGVVVIGIGVIVIADDVDVRIAEREIIHLFISPIYDKLMGCPFTDPCRCLM